MQTKSAAPEGATTTESIRRLSEIAQEPVAEGAVEAVREFLGMEVAYATEHTDSEQLIRVLRGDGESFGVGEGTVTALEQTYCHRVLDGRLPNIIGDVRADQRAARLAVTEAADVGAFVSVPLRRSDGQLLGTLCAASHDPHPELGYRELQFFHVFARMIADGFEREELYERTSRLERKLAVSTALIKAVEARDAYTAEHSRGVVELAAAVAGQLQLDPDQSSDVEQVALLHDIGKIRVPDAILHKPGPLNEVEWEEMHRHPVYGEELVSEIPDLAHLAPAMRAAHERFDGGGYPDGLAGTEIPIASRIVLACDAYHAMISERPYRAPIGRTAAVDELVANAGTQFDSDVVEALLAVLATRRTY